MVKFKKKKDDGIGDIAPYMERYSAQRKLEPEGSGFGAIAHIRRRYSIEAAP